MAVTIFFSYAHEDEQLLKRLKAQLRPMQHQGLVEALWNDRDISAGTDWEHEIVAQLNVTQIILLLISPDFMDSDYCYSVEMMRALERHERGEARVIPIIVRPVDWQSAPFSKLQVLPADGKPVTLWRNYDNAFLDIARGIRKVVERLIKSTDAISQIKESREESSSISHEGLPAGSQTEKSPAATSPTHATGQTDTPGTSQKTEEQWLTEGDLLTELGRYEIALATYDEAIQLDPANAETYNSKGWVLDEIGRYKDALVVYKQAIRLNPNYEFAYNNKGNALSHLKLYKKALTAFDHAIRLDPDYANAYNGKGYALAGLERYAEALIAYEQALQLNPNEAMFHNNKGTSLSSLERYEEAIASYEQAIRLDSSYTNAYYNKGNALYHLTRYEEALVVYEQALLLAPNDVDIYYNIGKTLKRLGRFKEAQHIYERALQTG